MSAGTPDKEDTRERLNRIAERRLTAEELDAWVRAAMDDQEREEIVGHIRWFRRRYPNPLDRLRSARRAYRNAARRAGTAR